MSSKPTIIVAPTNYHNKQVIELTGKGVEPMSGKLKAYPDCYRHGTSGYDRSQPEPAPERHEIVHIAATNSDLRATDDPGHKVFTPEFTGRIQREGVLGKYWILKIPCRSIVKNNYNH